MLAKRVTPLLLLEQNLNKTQNLIIIHSDTGPHIIAARNPSKHLAAEHPVVRINYVCPNKGPGKFNTIYALLPQDVIDLFLSVCSQSGFDAKHRRRRGILSIATFFNNRQRCRQSWRFGQKQTQSFQQQCSKLKF